MKLVAPSLILILCLFTFPAAAHLVNNGAQIVVSNNTTVNSTGNLTNQESSTISSNGNIRISGNCTNNGDMTLNGDQNVTGNFVNDGTITLNANLNLAGNWTNTSSGQGFSNGSTGTVNLNGTNQTLAGATTFPNLTKTVTSSATLTFTAGSSNQTTITGTTTLKGVTGQYLALRSSSPGTQWQFDPQGTRDFDFFDVQDSNNVNATEIDVTAANKINSGNNTNWLFGDESYTVEFVSGGNGTLTGETTQTIVHDNDCTPVTANPDMGFTFANWSGDRSSTDNPFTVTNVKKNMTITANFSPSVFTVRFNSQGKGYIKGQKTQQIEYGGDCSEVIPVPRAHHHFENWTGDYVGTDDPLTVTNVTADMDITANFALDQFTLTFVQGANGTLTGNLMQVVDYGGNATPVTATADAGYSFIGWSGDYSGIKNPLTIKKVSADMTINSNFQDTSTIEQMVPASIFNIDQSEVTDLTQFTHPPKIYGLYYDPIKDPKQVKDKTPHARCLSNPTKKTPLTNVDFYWRKSISLYDKRDFRDAYRQGITCEDYLIANPIETLLVSIYLKTTEDRMVYDQNIRPFHMPPPAITAIRNQSDTANITQATLEKIFIIKGTFFSRNFQGKAPIVWLEYLDSRGQIKSQRLKVLMPLKYPNPKGKTEKSCMDVNTGDSEITVEMPSRWPRDWDQGADHNIVIDNSTGLATADFGTY